MRLSYLRGRDFLTLTDFKPQEFRTLLERSFDHKKGLVRSKPLSGKHVAAIFEKPSTRTRISMTVAVESLGGNFINLSEETMQISRGESLRDTALVLSRYVDAIAARVKKHETLEELAKWASVPVINMLSDRYHPLQALADIMTIVEEFGHRKVSVVFLGDGATNTALSLMHASALMGYDFRIGAPLKYQPPQQEVEISRKIAERTGGSIEVFEDPERAVKGADVVYTDTWVSMGVTDVDERMRAFKRYQVNSDIMKLASKDAIVMHCQPWFIGQEITEEVAYGERSRAFDQAENRLHTAKAVLEALIA
ncbi:MAG: ornithine carbamoyltransferase [Candidatus Methanodesulfokora sp.]|jgi:ornithine carbamoyltransferase